MSLRDHFLPILDQVKRLCSKQGVTLFLAFLAFVYLLYISFEPS